MASPWSARGSALHYVGAKLQNHVAFSADFPIGPSLSDLGGHAAPMTFDGSPLLQLLKKLLGWSGPAPAMPPSKPGISPDRPVVVSPEVPNAIRTWRSAFRLPFARPRTRTEQLVYDAIRDNRSLTFVYYGGSDAGSLRTVDPIILFRVEGFDGAYLIAYCRLRQEFRTFRVARMGLSDP